MAAACTAMEIHDRHRLSISKASAKISKPSPSSVLKSLSVSASASSPSSSPPRQLPSSITSSPSRPIAKVVTADPSSFRRVVQELTGTTPSPSSNAGTSPRVPSRLQRIAPPPLRAAIRTSLADPPPHQHSLLEQMQHHQASHMLLLQQHLPKVGPHSPALSFSEVSSSNSTVISKLPPKNANPYSNHGSEQAFQFGNSNPNFSQSLPMLSPHLLSPLPALTPGDSTWANPIEVIGHSPKFMGSTSNSLPPLLPLPNVSSTSSSSNGYGNTLLQRPAYGIRGQNDGMLTRPAHFMANSLATSYGQPQSLPPLLSTPLQTPSFNGVLPPWSPSPLPFSPGSFPVSPGGPGPPVTTASSLASNAQYNSHIRYGSANPSGPNNFTF